MQADTNRHKQTQSNTRRRNWGGEKDIPVVEYPAPLSTGTVQAHSRTPRQATIQLNRVPLTRAEHPIPGEFSARHATSTVQELSDGHDL